MITASRSDDPFGRIALVAYNADWLNHYREIVSSLRSAFPESAQFHHIGSTAVPGMAAKDIIDVQATVGGFDDVDGDRLAALSYAKLPVQSDHAPAGRHIAASELEKRFFRGMARPANLHVRINGRFNQRYPLLCRDYLRAHPVTAASYQLIKQRLAHWFPDDADRYYDVKDPLFDVIMDGAEAWAKLLGWTLPPGDA
ncbi:GrpB family protein [Chelatococcus reniformis]|uniref:GrpB family protein n=1 Tax=Chelatococcus reniformis TaxID=1494448 RepID=A0A916XAM4_9HYPH|nr:GrpB family protein [Chelatococcus reniformis]GGC57799.1 hypothetical protein GCM10010994_15980 [Chelatococcus reniformis]